MQARYSRAESRCRELGVPGMFECIVCSLASSRRNASQYHLDEYRALSVRSQFPPFRRTFSRVGFFECSPAAATFTAAICHASQ